MQHYTITILILLAALACYSLGFGLGAYVLFAAGAVFELWFWVRLIRGKPKAGSSQG